MKEKIAKDIRWINSSKYRMAVLKNVAKLNKTGSRPSQVDVLTGLKLLPG